jgi:hypothetical protein
MDVTARELIRLHKRGRDCASATLAPMRLILRTPATNTRGPLYTDQALAALHSALPHGATIGLLVSATTDSIALCCECPPSFRSVLEN